MKKMGYALVLVVALCLAWQERKQLRASKDWPSAQGVIVDGWIKEGYSSTSKKHEMQQYEYEANVRYAFTVDGLSYTGDRISLRHSPSSSRSRAEDELAKYPKGQPVKVYYDPKDPEQSVLKPYLGRG